MNIFAGRAGAGTRFFLRVMAGWCKRIEIRVDHGSTLVTHDPSDP